MLTHYLRIAFRALWKQKGYAFINIFGLAIGLAFCLLILRYVQDERSFDRFHENVDRLYRVNRVSFDPDGAVRATDNYLPFPLGAAMQTDLPEVEAFTRLFERALFVRKGEDAFEEDVLFADAPVFDMFTFPLIQGDPRTVFDNANNVILTPSIARKYFGSTDPMGKTLAIRMGNQFEDFTVAGIAQEVPSNSSVRFGILVPFQKLPQAFSWIRRLDNSWNISAFITYVLLREDVHPQAVQSKLAAFRAKYYPNEAEQLRERGRWEGDGIPTTYGIQPITDIHLNMNVSAGLTPPSDPMYGFILAGIAFAVLLIACINFMTLAIGRSARRAKEIGIRKVVGAVRGQLMRQFWGEAMLLCGVALLAGIALASLFLPTFNTLTDKTLQLELLAGSTLLILSTAVLVTGLLAGSYPALILSGFRPIEALKDRLKLSGSNVFTRSLVVVQFGLSAFLITTTLVMLHQMDFLRTSDLGFNREHLVVIPTNGIAGNTALPRLRNELGNRSEIIGISGSNTSFSYGSSNMTYDDDEREMKVYFYEVDTEYLDVMGIDLVAGRDFNPQLARDSVESVIVNEALVRAYGWTDPVGQTVTGLRGPGRDPTVIGVVEDYKFASLEEQVEPVVISINSGEAGYMGFLLVRIAPTDIPGTLALLKDTWGRIAPDIPFQYTFMDEDLAKQYADYEQWSQMVTYAALFAILIACLGLFGLAALTVAARTKEIGIRKVLGASVSGITLLIAKSFAGLVGIALCFAAPVAYLASARWLENFAYHITLPWHLFMLGGLLVLTIAALTVSYQAIRAARLDPVKTLRYE